MLILTIRSDNPDAEIGLYQDGQQVAYHTWQAHRHLAETLHQQIADLLANQQLTLQDLQGVVVFKGPGSFTGLRIGITVSNALAYGLSIPLVASENPDWIAAGVTRLLAGENEVVAMPEYGALPNITIQKK